MKLLLISRNVAVAVVVLAIGSRAAPVPKNHPQRSTELTYKAELTPRTELPGPASFLDLLKSGDAVEKSLLTDELSSSHLADPRTPDREVAPRIPTPTGAPARQDSPSSSTPTVSSTEDKVQMQLDPTSQWYRETVDNLSRARAQGLTPLKQFSRELKRLRKKRDTMNSRTRSYSLSLVKALEGHIENVVQVRNKLYRFGVQKIQGAYATPRVGSKAGGRPRLVIPFEKWDTTGLKEIRLYARSVAYRYRMALDRKDYDAAGADFDLLKQLNAYMDEREERERPKGADPPSTQQGVPLQEQRAMSLVQSLSPQEELQRLGYDPDFLERFHS